MSESLPSVPPKHVAAIQRLITLIQVEDEEKFLYESIIHTIANYTEAAIVLL